MVAIEERDVLLASLKGYLEELAESGLDELAFAVYPPVAAGSAVSPQSSAAGAPAGNLPAAPSVATSPPAAAGAEIEENGDPGSRLCFVMSGCGYRSEAGELLAKMVAAMKFSTSEVCLLTFADDAVPSRGELLSRLRMGGAEVVVALGEQSARLLLDSGEPVAALRGRFHQVAGLAVMPTLHPAQMLADQSLKRQVWSELQQVMRRLQAQWDH